MNEKIDSSANFSGIYLWKNVFFSVRGSLLVTTNLRGIKPLNRACPVGIRFSEDPEESSGILDHLIWFHFTNISFLKLPTQKMNLVNCNSVMDFPIWLVLESFIVWCLSYEMSNVLRTLLCDILPSLIPPQLLKGHKFFWIKSFIISLNHYYH